MEDLYRRVLKLLSAPVHFLMFRGGSGGEFLSTKIYQYSKKYLNPNVQFQPLPNNKTQVNYPKFFNNLIAIPSQDNSFVSTLLSVTTEADVIEAENYLKNIPNLSLLRCHYRSNIYFKNKSFFVLLDEEKWWEYAGLLVMLKNFSTPEDIDQRIRWFKQSWTNESGIGEEHNNTVTEIKNFMYKNKLTKISDTYVIVASNKNLRTTHTVEDILNCPIDMLYYKYDTYQHNTYSKYRSSLGTSFMKVINYSNYFDKGYLEDVFEIDSNNFHYELIEWHEKNLELLSNNNIDIAKFKLS